MFRSAHALSLEDLIKSDIGQAVCKAVGADCAIQNNDQKIKELELQKQRLQKSNAVLGGRLKGIVQLRIPNTIKILNSLQADNTGTLKSLNELKTETKALLAKGCKLNNSVDCITVNCSSWNWKDYTCDIKPPGKSSEHIASVKLVKQISSSKASCTRQSQEARRSSHARFQIGYEENGRQVTSSGFIGEKKYTNKNPTKNNRDYAYILANDGCRADFEVCYRGLSKPELIFMENKFARNARDHARKSGKKYTPSSYIAQYGRDHASYIAQSEKSVCNKRSGYEWISRCNGCVKECSRDEYRTGVNNHFCGRCLQRGSQR